jgi:hypothetical protein
LLSKLTDKGIKERSLINNIKKVYPKKMKFRKEKLETKAKDLNKDETESSVDSEFEYDSDDLKKLIKDWHNVEGKFDVEKKKENAPKKTEFEKIYTTLFAIEEKFTEYLDQFDKEWDSTANREDLKAFMSMNTDVNQFSQAFLFLVERFKNPYKLDEFMEEDEISENYRYSIFSSEGKIEVSKMDERRILAPRGKISFNH